MITLFNLDREYWMLGNYMVPPMYAIECEDGRPVKPARPVTEAELQELAREDPTKPKHWI